MHFLKLSFFGIFLFALANPALARDISNEQRAASEARDRYNQTLADEASLTKQIADQEKRVATEQARLQDLQAKQVENKAAVENAKKDLDAKSEVLEKVWEERNKN